MLNKKLLKTDKKERKSNEKHCSSTVKMRTDSSGKINMETRGILTELQPNSKAEVKSKQNC